jgi:hypothetical protein
MDIDKHQALLTQETLNKTRIKLYITLALSASLRRSETWNITARHARRVTAAEM